jgi:hypothetical protein
MCAVYRLCGRFARVEHWVERVEGARILTYSSDSKGGAAFIGVNDDVLMVKDENTITGLE